MLQPIKHILASKRIILASGSPRRRELLEQMCLDVKVVPSDYDEELVKFANFDSPAAFVEELARRKANEVCARVESTEGANAADVILAADTVVTLDGRVFGKPTSRQHAHDMITSLSGRTHQVYSGVCVLHRGCHDDDHAAWQNVCFSEMTRVTMATLTSHVISAYVATNEPLDKAGGYGIQALGGSLVSHIEGDYYNVVGLPLHRLCCVLYDLYKHQPNSS